MIEHAYRRAVDNIQVARHEAHALSHILTDPLGDEEIRSMLSEFVGKLADALQAAEATVAAARDDMRKQTTKLAAKAHGVDLDYGVDLD